MNPSQTLYQEFPLFTGPLSTGPSHVWEYLDDATREQAVQHVARLLVAHTQPDACRTVLPQP